MVESLPHVLVLLGPTASGKTPISLHIAPHLHAEIISADSRQIYKYMDIGTAKPTIAERKDIRHYFIDELTPDKDFNAGEFGKQGRQIIEDIVRRKKTPLIVGGSGLYIQALVDGFFDGPSADPSLRKRLYERIKDEGPAKLLRELKSVDPDAASKMLPTNVRRLVRALEVYQLTGTPISQLQQEGDTLQFIPCFAGLQWDRAILYRRIDDRTDRMMEQGLIKEVRHLQDLGYTQNLNALQTVGYKEIFDYLSGKTDYDRTVGLIKQNSRRYAKRQLTWFRRDKRIRWFNVNEESDFSSVANDIINHFLSR